MGKEESFVNHQTCFYKEWCKKVVKLSIVLVFTPNAKVYTLLKIAMTTEQSSLQLALATIGSVLQALLPIVSFTSVFMHTCMQKHGSKRFMHLLANKLQKSATMIIICIEYTCLLIVVAVAIGVYTLLLYMHVCAVCAHTYVHVYVSMCVCVCMLLDGLVQEAIMQWL